MACSRAAVAREQNTDDPMAPDGATTGGNQIPNKANISERTTNPIDLNSSQSPHKGYVMRYFRSQPIMSRKPREFFTRNTIRRKQMLTISVVRLEHSQASRLILLHEERLARR